MPAVVIVANDARCLEPLCGVSTLERLLRILQRIGFGEATVLATDADIIAALNRPSWARSELRVRVLPLATPVEAPSTLRIPADLYCDARLLRALSNCTVTTDLVDSAPPLFVQPLLGSGRPVNSGAALIAGGTATVLDAAAVPSYVVGMRRNIRPVFFSAPTPLLRLVAERIILDTAQNGTLDIPAILQSPVEDAVMRWLWCTSITPNQITAFGALVALLATASFATGHLWLGMVPALAIGVIDGLDGKQARVKIETTESGKLEHIFDFFIETSWWAALAFWFWRSGELPSAWICFGVIMAAEGVDQLAKRAVKLRTGKLLDDVAPFDRFVRRIGARRDIYIWALVVGLACRAAPQTYFFCAAWGAITAAVHVARAIIIRR